MTALRRVPDGPSSGSAVERPMYSDDAELAVLGAIMSEPAALRVVRPLLLPEDFAGGDAAETYATMLAIADRGGAIDPVTVYAELERGPAAASPSAADELRRFVHGLQHSVPSSSNVEYHAELVLRHAKRRALLATFDGAAAQLRQDTRAPADVAAAVGTALTAVVEAEPYLPRARCLLDAPVPEPVRWLIDDFWLAGEVGLFVGDDGSYKSTAALAMVAAVAGGYRVFDRFVCRRRPTLYVSAEDPENVIHSRVEALITGHGWNRSRVLEHLHVIYDPDACLADEKWQSHIRAEVERVNAGLVVLDPLADLLGGDENSNSDVRALLKFARRLTRITGTGETAVTVVHHMGKKQEGKREVDRIRGASAIRSAGRCNYAFEALEGGISVVNMKMSRAEKLRPFVLELDVAHQAANRAEWTRASLVFKTARHAAQNRGEAFVVAQLRAAAPRRLTTTQLKEIAGSAGHRVSGQDVWSGLNTLSAKGLIDYEAGARGTKYWGLVPELPSQSPDRSTLPDALNSDDSDGAIRSYPLRARSNADDISSPEADPDLADLAPRLPGKVEQAARRSAGGSASDPAAPLGARQGQRQPAPTGNHSPNGNPPGNPPRRSRE